MRELTWTAILLGVVIGALLAAANAYVGLKVGMTVSASIPAAVISMAIFRCVLRRGTLLENNIVQTIGSAGQSLAAGMIFTVPALFMWGQDPAMLDMLLWASIGGLLGVVFMVPLRRVLIVREHDTLPYPEGVACAEVLRCGERGGVSAGKIFRGLFVASGYEFLRRLGFWRDEVELAVRPAGTTYQTKFMLDASPALLGVGYILGVRVAGYILGGAVLGWFVILPCIAFFGSGKVGLTFPPPGFELAQPDAAQQNESFLRFIQDLYGKYLKYIGAGAVAVGGILSVVKSLKTVGRSVWHVAGSAVRRDRVTLATDRDLPLPLLFLMLVGLGYAMWRMPQVHVGPLGAAMVIVAAFLFVTVSSRLVGMIGQSSNPISGMTIATLLGTAILFSQFVGTGMSAKFGALSVGAIVCVAIGIAGDCSQDLKTGFLLKATPWKQQVGEIIGVLTSGVVVVVVIRLLAHTYGFGDASGLPAPQATVMKMVIDGVMDANLPWVLVLTGGAVALAAELFGIPPLPVAVGLYLPLGLSMPIMVGGLLRWLLERFTPRRRRGEETDAGVLTASGFVAGAGLVGVLMAGVTALISYAFGSPKFQSPSMSEAAAVRTEHFVPWIWMKLGWERSHDWGLSSVGSRLLPIIPFALLIAWLVGAAVRRPRHTGGTGGSSGRSGPAPPGVGPPSPAQPTELIERGIPPAVESPPATAAPLADEPRSSRIVPPKEEGPRPGFPRAGDEETSAHDSAADREPDLDTSPPDAVRPPSGS
jgi:putative OPT family oligopeptide transporter